MGQLSVNPSTAVEFSVALQVRGVGLGIRFFGLVRVGFFGLRKIRLSKTINRSVLKETKNRHRKCQFFGSVFRCNRTEPSLILTERYQATVQTFQADSNQNSSSNVKI